MKVFTALKLDILIITPLIFLIILLFITIYMFIKKFQITTHNRLLQFNRALFDRSEQNKDQLQESAMPYQEMQAMDNLFNYTMNILNMYRELKLMDLNFSIETFIDQFGKIFCSDAYQHILPCDRFSLAVYNSNENTLVAFHATLRGDRHIFLKKGFTQKLNETSLQKMVDQQSPYRIINNLDEHNSISAQLLLKEDMHSNLTIPIFINQRIFGFIFFAHRQHNMYDDDIGNTAVFVSSILRTRIFYSYALQTTLYTFGDEIVNLLEFKDDETLDHTRRVSLYAALMAEELQEQEKITPQKAEEIYSYAPLHDLGKIGIPDSILLKPGKLTEDEWNVMKQHPIIGGKLIKNTNEQLIHQFGVGMLKTAYCLIIDHHEWWDGSGYPQGKQGMDISIEGQIVAIADVFDALTTKRPYKEAFPIEQALLMIQNQSGTHFNPELVDIFIQKRTNIGKIYQHYYLHE